MGGSINEASGWHALSGGTYARIVPGGMVLSTTSDQGEALVFVPCSFTDATDWIKANMEAADG